MVHNGTKGAFNDIRAVQKQTNLRSVLINPSTVKLIKAEHQDNGNYAISKFYFDIGGIQNEFYATAFRHKIYNSIEELQADLDAWVLDYNEQPTHSGKYCFGKTPRQTFLDSKHIAIEKQLNRTHQTTKSALVTA